MKTINSARYVTPSIESVAGYPIRQQHQVQFLDPVEAADGRVLPAGTRGSILSSGSLNGRPSICLSLSETGEQVHIYA